MGNVGELIAGVEGEFFAVEEAALVNGDCEAVRLQLSHLPRRERRHAAARLGCRDARYDFYGALG